MNIRARFLALLLALLAVPASAAIAPPDRLRGDASQLRARFEQVRPRLEKNEYGRPLALDSREMNKALEGDAYALVTQPFGKVDSAMARAGDWCELLMLPFNTKHCTASADGSGLALFVGRKNDTPIESAYKLDFAYRVVARTPDYLQVVLTADSGPLGTRDYRIVLELAPLDPHRTFLHLSYSYAYGAISKVAMQAYLSTIGAKKVGFSLVDGQPVRGMRGIMERNTMRYFLAVDAYLASLEVPEGTRVTKRLNDWYSAQANYPVQLDEDVTRADYLAMKQKEYARVAAARVASGG